MPFAIRPSREADFDTLWRIDQACFDPELSYSRRELAFYMGRPGALTLLAEGDEGASENGDGAGVLLSGEGLITSEPNPQTTGYTGVHRGTQALNQKFPSVIGFIVAEFRRKTGHIITIDVVDEARKSGVGSALLEAAEKQLLKKGARSVALETPVDNLVAIRFYRRHGYIVEKTLAGYYAGRLDALAMGKGLVETASEG